MSVFKASLWFSLGTLFSRLFGLLRESVTAGVFGASVGLDAFFVANRIPNMLRELFAEGALGSSFTKVFSETWERDETKGRQLFHEALHLFGLLSLILCFLGVLFAPELVAVMTSLPEGRAEAAVFTQQAVGLTRLLFPFIGLMILSSLAAGALHQRGRFFLSSLAPIALNVGYLLGALVFARLCTAYAPAWVSWYFAEKAVTGLALGVLLGGILQLAVLLAGVWRPLMQSPSRKPRLQGRGLRAVRLALGLSPELKKVLTLMGPMLIAASAGQINVLVNTNFATRLPTGTVTWLTFSFRLLQLPIGIFAVGVGAVALPLFTRCMLRSESERRLELSNKVLQMSEFMLWMMLPCLCYIMQNAQAMIQLLFEHGKFSPRDSLATAEALYYYSFGLLGYGLIKVFTALYYALDRTNYAMKVSLVGIFLNFGLNYLLVDKYAHCGLAITASALLSLNALGLAVGLTKERLYLPRGELLKMLGWLSLAFTASYALQVRVSSMLASLGFMHAVSLKAQALVYLACNSLVIGVIFGGCGLLRLGKNPKAAFLLLRQAKAGRGR